MGSGQRPAPRMIPIGLYTHAEWFERSRHCGKCGQPGDFCLCRESDPCGCRALHPMGSGLGVDPAEKFAAPGVDQDGLF